MNRYTSIAVSAAALLCVGTVSSTFAQQAGTAEEARAMLVKAAAAVKADRDIALEMFNKGEGGFRDRELYPFCFRISDGKGVATPVYVPSGKEVKTPSTRIDAPT